MNEEEQVVGEVKEATEQIVEEVQGVVQDVVETVVPNEAQVKDAPRKPKSTHTLRDALEQVEYFGQAVSGALQGRSNVVMVRVNDEALGHLDMLVEGEITKSRSESAAFLINEGIAANQELFGKISAITEKIAELRELLRSEVASQPKEGPKA